MARICGVRSMNKAKEIRELSGLSRAAFCRQYGIPARTMEDWEAGKRIPPDYVLAWLERLVRLDFNK